MSLLTSMEASIRCDQLTCENEARVTLVLRVLGSGNHESFCVKNAPHGWYVNNDTQVHYCSKHNPVGDGK